MKTNPIAHRAFHRALGSLADNHTLHATSIREAIRRLPNMAMHQMASVILAEQGEPAAWKFCRKFGARSSFKKMIKVSELLNRNDIYPATP